MHEITAVYHIVTPMFLGSAHPKEPVDSIRPPSVKGALRFWWRALAWSEFKKPSVTNAAALQAIHREEARIFGSAASDTQGGQSSFLMQVTTAKLKSTAAGLVHPEFSRCAGARYLGYGLMEAFDSQKKNTHAGQLGRPCIDDGQTFELRFRMRQEPPESLLNALKVFGLLGGLGSRARHGMGSVSLESLQQDGALLWSAPQSPDAYRASVNGILSSVLKADVGLPPFSAFSPLSRVDLLFQGERSPIGLLNAFGEAQMYYRSWGKNGKVLTKSSEKNFPLDHDWKYGKAPQDFHPRRVVFGLPHNYGKNKTEQVVPEKLERRASPLFFHVHRLDKEMYLGISILLRAAFLPDGVRIQARGRFVQPNIEWSVITDFLDGQEKESALARFPQRMPL